MYLGQTDNDLQSNPKQEFQAFSKTKGTSNPASVQ